VSKWISTIDGRFDMDQAVLMFDPISSNILEGNQPTCRQYLSIHGSYYRILSSKKSYNIDPFINHLAFIYTTCSSVSYYFILVLLIVKI